MLPLLKEGIFIVDIFVLFKIVIKEIQYGRDAKKRAISGALERWITDPLVQTFTKFPLTSLKQRCKELDTWKPRHNSTSKIYFQLKVRFTHSLIRCLGEKRECKFEFRGEQFLAWEMLYKISNEVAFPPWKALALLEVAAGVTQVYAFYSSTCL